MLATRHWSEISVENLVFRSPQQRSSRVGRCFFRRRGRAFESATGLNITVATLCLSLFFAAVIFWRGGLGNMARHRASRHDATPQAPAALPQDNFAPTWTRFRGVRGRRRAAARIAGWFKMFYYPQIGAPPP
jgi:hypothetical protein